MKSFFLTVRISMFSAILAYAHSVYPHVNTLNEKRFSMEIYLLARMAQTRTTRRL